MWTVAATPLGSQRHALASVLAGATTAATAVWYNSTLLEEASSATAEETSPSTGNKDDPTENNPIEINLMDKISNKVYLNPVRVRGPLQKRNSDTPPPSVTDPVKERPVGVPSHLRILAIDLPEMRDQAFAKGVCRVALDRVYPDGVAPAKQVGDQETAEHKEATTTNTSAKQRLEVEQKIWVKSMVKCMQHDLPDKVGVQLMEASFSNLNPKNLRKTRQVGGYHYDPGKYTNNGAKEMDQESATEDYQVQEEDELDAPWNQYAWIEELKLRIHGLVPFGDTLEPSSRWSRYYSGNHYKQTVPSQARWYLPSFLQPDPEGIDGTDTANNNIANNNWASHKPHAVIANGAAVQRMPSGLRLLQHSCREANVPLFVLYDPRAWGGNTHQSLHQALRDVRFIVKQNIILSAMEHQSGFSRGRRVGRMERTVEQWTAQAKQDRQRRQEAFKKRQWQKLDAASLEKKLIDHGVLRKEDHDRQYTPAFKKIARQCVADIEQEMAEEGVPVVAVKGDKTQEDDTPVKETDGDKAHL